MSILILISNKYPQTIYKWNGVMTYRNIYLEPNKSRVDNTKEVWCHSSVQNAFLIPALYLSNIKNYSNGNEIHCKHKILRDLSLSGDYVESCP